MRLSVCVLIWAALLPGTLLAQKPLPASSALTEPDQELDDFSGRFRGVHHITAKVRGVRGTNKTVYWVSANGHYLSAFQAGKLLWTSKVVAVFTPKISAARISSLVLTSNILFVSLGKRGSAEIDRKTGHMVSKYFDRDPLP